MRQQHQRHRGAVRAVLLVVLPQCTPAAVLRVGTEGRHLIDEPLVLAVGRLALVAEEVVASPRVGERVGGCRRERHWIEAEHAQCIDRLAVLGDQFGAGHLAEQEQRHHEHRDGDHTCGDGPHHKQFAIGVAPRAACATQDQFGGLDDADHHQQQPKQIEERQQSRVPQQPDEGQAVAGEKHPGHQREAADAQPGADQLATGDAGDEANGSEAGHEHVEECRPREEHVPEGVVTTVGSVAVLHVGHVGMVEQERQHPERRQQDRRTDDARAVAEPRAVHPHQPHQHHAAGDEQQHDAMRQHRQCQHDCCPAAVLAGLQATREQPEAEHAQRQRDGERELPRHRALHVAAVDREALVEEEDHPGERHQFRHRILEIRQATEAPAAERQGDQAEDHHDLHRNAIRQDDVERHDHQRRDDHVEAVHRKARVPVVAPPAELEVGQQVTTQERRAHHVRAHVAAGGGVVLEHEVEVHDLHHRPGATADDDQRGDIPHDPLDRPRRVQPALRPTDDPPTDSRYQAAGCRHLCTTGFDVRFDVRPVFTHAAGNPCTSIGSVHSTRSASRSTHMNTAWLTGQRGSGRWR